MAVLDLDVGRVKDYISKLTEEDLAVIHERLRQLNTDKSYQSGGDKLHSCYCTGQCIGPNGERRACGNYMCSPKIT